MNTTAYRLPTHARPRRYDIALDARLGRADFQGAVTIDLEIDESRETIELHARDLAITEARFSVGAESYPGVITADAAREMVELRFPVALPTGEARLALTFSGRISEGLTGLYLAQDGPERLLCTQCQATDARAIFPCFDEPMFKARFAFTVTTAGDATVLANGPLESVAHDAAAGAKTWRFAATEPMSSYLCGLVIGDVTSGPEQVVAGTPLRIWGVRGKEAMGGFALAWTAQLLPWYEDYFSAPYHYHKYDQVAVPGFAAGAMENAGLVLFRQNLLLMDPQTTAWRQEKGIAAVVAHEFAHMWFGDLVTMRWWDDVWLNEAFAEWIATKVTGELCPEYEVWDDFRLEKDAALRTDSLETTHPIYTPIETPAEAEEIFDVITYVKGCAVLHMLEGYLGAESFRAGLRTYMQEFAERNAAGADLWRHLQQASQEPVTAIMESWILESGYPLVTVSAGGAGAETTLRLSQRRFLSTPGATDPANPVWPTPLVIQYEDDQGVHLARTLLTEREATLPLPTQGALRWCDANAEDRGFYRVDLDAKLLQGLLAHLDRLGPTAQMGLLSDQWALVRSGARSITSFLDTLTALAAQDNRNVLTQVVGHMRALDDYLLDTRDTEALARYRAWVAATFRPKLADLGYDPQPGETQNRAQARVAVVGAVSALARDPAAVREATARADREAADPTAVDPNLADVFIGAAARGADAARFARYVQTYEERRSAGAAPELTNRYLYSFPAFEDPALVERALGLLDGGIIPQEGMMPILRIMLSQRHSQVAAWEYMKSHWERIEAIGGMTASSLIEAAGQLPAEKRDEIVAFHEAHLSGVAPKSYARALETLDQLAEFKARTREELLAWARSR
jgi:puromycin-sensitive aminopeptidase